MPPYYDPPCRRSARAYGSVYATSLATPEPTFANLACSGAKIGDMVASQFPYVVSNTDLVTLTIGGNDLGFAPVLLECIAIPSDCRDNSKQEQARALYTPLKDAYTSLKQAAPSARVVVLTYPQIFTNDNRVPNFECLGDKGITPEERTWLRSVTTTLNETIRTAAADASVEVVSLDDAFLDMRYARSLHTSADTKAPLIQLHSTRTLAAIRSWPQH